MTAKDELADTRVLLDLVNAADGSDYTLVRRLPGGYQEGAYEIQGSDGQRSALKWHRRPTPPERLVEAAPLVDEARDAGWPTPRWLSTGVAAGGERYVVQEFVPGHHLEHLDEAALDALLAVNAIQATVRPDTDQEWSNYVRDVVFENRNGWLGRIAGSCAEGAEFARAVRNLCTEPVDLPSRDLVCGVFALENILFHAGSVAGVIDVGAIGRGCRAFDLAVLYSRIEPDHPKAAPIERRLRTAAEAVAGPRQFHVCLAAEVIGVLAFGLEHWAGGIANASASWARRLEDLGSYLAAGPSPPLGELGEHVWVLGDHPGDGQAAEENSPLIVHRVDTIELLASRFHLALPDELDG